MKLIAFLFIFSIGISAEAQKGPDEQELQKTIETFFEGFHKQDSLLIKSVMADVVILQSVGKSKDGKTVVHEDSFENFLRSIVSIPSENSFREELHFFEIKIDGDMANVWTPYSFYFNGKLSHCGSNSFQLYKVEGKWKIFYLVDSRRREGCED